VLLEEVEVVLVVDRLDQEDPQVLVEELVEKVVVKLELLEQLIQVVEVVLVVINPLMFLEVQLEDQELL
jgi:hypothetical protein